MPKPYSLNLYSPVIDATEAFAMPLTPHVKGWKRSFRAMGGCWHGSFYSTAKTPGDIKGIQIAFENWLGYHVLEKVGGMPTWSGMIYEMDLNINGITRRRTLDLMANRVKTTYLTLAFTGDQFVNNTGFEDATAVGPPQDDFWAWGEGNGGNGSVRIAGAAHAGARCVQLNSDDDDITHFHAATYVRQHIAVTPGARYQITVWSKGDGGNPNPDHNHFGGVGSFGAYSPNAPTGWIVTKYVPVTAAWTFNKLEFIGPSEGEIFLYFIAPYWYDVGAGTSRTCYFDDASMLEEGQCVFEIPWNEPREYGPQQRYGVKEEIIHLDNYPLATSQAYRDTYMAEHAWPWPRPVTVTTPGEARIDVFVAGYVHTMNWMYVMEGDGADHNVSDWITAIVGTAFGRSWNHGGQDAGAGDCQFVRVGNVKANTLQVPEFTGGEERPWDVIQELVALGDTGGNPWQAAVGQDRRFHYMQVSTTPRYFIRKDGIYDTMAGNSPANPWTMVPGVFRDMTYRSNQKEPGSFLASQQDMWVEEVEMADGWARPALKTALFSESELLSARTERGG